MYTIGSLLGDMCGRRVEHGTVIKKTNVHAFHGEIQKNDIYNQLKA